MKYLVAEVGGAGDSDCDLAVIPYYLTLLKEWVRRIRFVADMKTQNSGLYCAVWWDYTPVFVSSIPLSKSEQRKLDEAGVVIVNKTKDFPSGHEHRVECSQLHVTEDDIYWTAIPKFYDFAVETHLVSLEVLKDEIRNLEGRGRVRRNKD